MKPKHPFVQIPAVILAFPFLGTFAQASITIEVVETFDYPGRTELTSPQTINDGLDIVGYFTTYSTAAPAALIHGFVRLANGHFSPPLHEPNDQHETWGFGINNARTVCGPYINSTGHPSGFFLTGSTYTEYDVPGSLDTSVYGINNVGDFVGLFSATDGSIRAFASLGGTVTKIDVPGATYSSAHQLNDTNTLVGYYNSGTMLHGFYQDSAGVLHAPIDPPGSTFTYLNGINDQNWMVGQYGDSSGATHGFLFIPPRKFVTFDYPGSTLTSLNGINKKGYICGSYTDAAYIEHGILARAVRSAGDDAEPEMKASSPSLPDRTKIPATPARPVKAPAS